MGINIKAYHFQGLGEEEDLPGTMHPFPLLEEVKGWDWHRHAGDRDIRSAVEYVYAPWSDFEGQLYYERPESIAELRAWVLANVHQGNQERWLTLLEQMEADETIWLHFSW